MVRVLGIMSLASDSFRQKAGPKTDPPYEDYECRNSDLVARDAFPYYLELNNGSSRS